MVKRPTRFRPAGKQSKAKLDGETVLVDKGIVGVIEFMNKCGFETFVSCSGLAKDHGFEELPYICGEKNQGFEVAAKRAGWEVKGDKHTSCAYGSEREKKGDIFSPFKHLGDAKIRTKWKVLKNEFGKKCQR